MLTAPAHSELEGVTIYADDEEFWRYYLVPQYPSVRRDTEGKPVFLLIKYGFSDEDREADPDLPAGGGYMNFDVTFEVPDTLREQAAGQLQAEIDAEWERLRRGTAEDRQRPGVRGTAEAPRLEWGTPTWIDGTIKLDAPQSEDLVAHRVAEGTPSLLAGNISVFSMDLTAAGSTFMERTLVTPAGEGSDLTPLQVKYDLTFWARLPSVRIHISAHSEQMHEQTRKIVEGSGRRYCSSYDFENTDTSIDTAESSGLIDVQIDPGSSQVDAGELSELRSFALDLVSDLVQSAFFTTEPPDDEMETELPDTEEEAEETSGKKKNKKYYFQRQYSKATMDIQLDLEQRSVVEWPIHPQATLQTFFSEMNPDELKQFVKEIPLGDDFFSKLDLTCQVFADWSDSILGAVEVEVTYQGPDHEGNNEVKSKTFTFSKNDAAAKKWNPGLLGGRRDYQWRYRPLFIGIDGEAARWSNWTKSTSHAINVPLPDAGHVRATVQTGNVDWNNLVEQVQVTLAYEDADSGVSREEQPFVLRAGAASHSYDRPILTLVDKTIQYKTRFVLKSGTVLEDDEWKDLPGRFLVVDQPYVDTLKVTLLPTGDGWDSVGVVVVELQHVSGGEHPVSETFMLRNREEFKTWVVRLEDGDPKNYKYKVTINYTDRAPEIRDWVHVGDPHDEVLSIQVDAPHRLKVTVLADNLRYENAPTTTVSFDYDSGGVSGSETFAFTMNDKASKTWVLELPDGAPLTYSYEVSHTTVDGEQVKLAKAQSDDAILVLLPWVPPEAGNLEIPVLALLVDFDATPIVAVDIKVGDGADEQTRSVLFTERGSDTANFEVENRNDASHRYRITWTSADGTSHEGDWKFQSLPRIIVPAWSGPGD